MSKKSFKSKYSNSKSPASRKSVPAPTTVVRNTPVPRPATKPAVTHEMIAKRAYEIYRSPRNGSQDENWLRAERELRG